MIIDEEGVCFPGRYFLFWVGFLHEHWSEGEEGRQWETAEMGTAAKVTCVSLQLKC